MISHKDQTAMGRFSIAILMVVAVVLLLPMLVHGVIEAHNTPHNLLWAGQFVKQVYAGILYPRWLPESFHGLGSPTFYFYPPLPFWIDALVGAISLDALPTVYRLAVTALLLLFASGIAMYIWLRRETASRTAALLGAIAYMAAPYHMLDYYIRGALAEYSAYAILPLVVLAVRICPERRLAGPILLAVSYAALLLTHLPIALLASITIVPSYVLFRAWRLGEWQAAIGLILRAASAGILGIGLAAVFLVPALTLMDWITFDRWSMPYQVQPENWFLLRPDRWFNGAADVLMQIIVSVAISGALIAVALCIAMPLMARVATRWEVGYWSTLTLICLTLIAGLVPSFWTLPWVGKVQFPWRLTMVVEFATVTGLSIVLSEAWRIQRGRGFILAAVVPGVLVAAGVALVPGVSMLLVQASVRIEFTVNNAPQLWEAAEYLPRDYGRSGGDQGPADWSVELFRRFPLISCSPEASVCRAEEKEFGALSIEVESDVPTTVVLRRFAFPSWRIEPDQPIHVTDGLRLVSFVAATGYSSSMLRHVMLPAEKWGMTISGVSLLVLVGAVVFAGTRRRWARTVDHQ